MSIDLSVVIPTLNEAATVPRLLADLAAQKGVAIEILVSDGGSTDGTREVASAALAHERLAGAVWSGPAGRGRQLNRGAARASGGWLLFLHADSRLPDPATLARSLALLGRSDGSRRCGHFALQFDLPDAHRDFGYYLGEVKARSGFPGTIHGDQGFLMPAGFFRELGGFREDLPVLEDTLLAETVRKQGEWLLLPAPIVTSPRRFVVEGYAARQTLNALLLNFAVIGWDEPLQRLPALYLVQGQAGRLDPGPCFRMVDDLLKESSLADRWRIWRRTGTFVRDNAWQLKLRGVAGRAYRVGLPPAAVPLEPLARCRRRFDTLSDNPPGRLLATLLSWLWFRSRRRSPSRRG